MDFLIVVVILALVAVALGGQADLKRRIDAADAMFGIIDGYRIRQSLDGHAEGNMRLQQSMTAMISLVMGFLDLVQAHSAHRVVRLIPVSAVGPEEFQLARRRVLREFQSRVDVLAGQPPSSRLSSED